MGSRKKERSPCSPSISCRKNLVPIPGMWVEREVNCWPPSEPLTSRLHASAQHPFSLGASGCLAAPHSSAILSLEERPCPLGASQKQKGFERPSAFRIPAPSKNKGPLCSPQ